MSSLAVEYFLGKILLDYGSVGLTNAMNSLNAHIKYYESKFKTTAHKLRKILELFDSVDQRDGSIIKESDINVELHRNIKESLKSNSIDRIQRLEKANKIPRRRQTISTVYLRNPDVVAEVLLRADGTCECCEKPAPFIRSSDGSPYLEVHHKKQLAKGGEDTVENAVALCPNCHRESHFGVQ